MPREISSLSGRVEARFDRALANRARDISSGRRFTELGGNYYQTFEYDPDINGQYLRRGNGPYIYNTGTGREGRYIPGHDISADGTLTRTYLLPRSQAPAVSHLSRQDTIRQLSLIENPDGTFRRQGFVGTYTVRNDGTMFYGGGHHPNAGRRIDLPPQTYINGRWYEGDVRLDSTPPRMPRADEAPPRMPRAEAPPRPSTTPIPPSTTPPATAARGRVQINGTPAPVQVQAQLQMQAGQVQGQVQFNGENPGSTFSGQVQIQNNQFQGQATYNGQQMQVQGHLNPGSNSNTLTGRFQVGPNVAELQVGEGSFQFQIQGNRVSGGLTTRPVSTSGTSTPSPASTPPRTPRADEAPPRPSTTPTPPSTTPPAARRREAPLPALPAVPPIAVRTSGGLTAETNGQINLPSGVTLASIQVPGATRAHNFANGPFESAAGFSINPNTGAYRFAPGHTPAGPGGAVGNYTLTTNDGRTINFQVRQPQAAPPPSRFDIHQDLRAYLRNLLRDFGEEQGEVESILPQFDQAATPGDNDLTQLIPRRDSSLQQVVANLQHLAAIHRRRGETELANEASRLAQSIQSHLS